MELYDYLTDEDKLNIKEFIQSYANCNVQDLRKVLSTWSKNKRTLFKALGKQMRVKIPIALEEDDQLLTHKLREVYNWIYIDSYSYDVKLNRTTRFDNKFVEAVVKRTYETVDLVSWNNVDHLFQYSLIKRGSLYIDLNIQGKNKKPLKLPRGMKVIKAISSYLRYIDFEDKELFEQWRNQISNITTSKNINSTLVFSIHPLDFLAMSDNNSGWQSCMSWVQDGAHSSGVIEMLNSNVAIVCYLESKKPYVFNMRKIPNKSWRSLAFIHKKLLLLGKSYPYYNEKLSKAIVQELYNIVKKNLSWEYQYKNQLYKDNVHFHSNHYLRRINYQDLLPQKKSIYVYTYGMYNDIIEDHSDIYWCYRNYVDHSMAICLSGPATCMCCGESLEPEGNGCKDDYRNDEDYWAHGDTKYCRKCEDKYWCSIEKMVNSDLPHYKIPYRAYHCISNTQVSLDALKVELVACRYIDKPDVIWFSPRKFLYDKDSNTLILPDNVEFAKDVDIEQYKISYSI